MVSKGDGMKVNQYAGWTLVLGTILLLVTLGRIDLLLILLPLSLLLAFAIATSKRGSLDLRRC
jgi:hypothetical protein